MKIVMLLTLFGGIFLFETPGLVYRKYWKELIVFLGFLSVAFVFSLLPLLGVKLPSPAQGITVIVEYFLGLFTSIIK